MTNDLKKWLNKKESSKEIVTDSLIQKYKACLSADVDVKNLLGLHWCLTQPKETRLNLNIDGHIKKGNFMPPIPLEQRMWAASSISFFEDLSSVNEIERFSEIKKILIHQANAKMDDAIVKRLYKLYNFDTPENIMPLTVDKFGNSSVATVPTMYDLILKGNLENHQINKGDKIVFAICDVAFGYKTKLL